LNEPFLDGGGEVEATSSSSCDRIEDVRNDVSRAIVKSSESWSHSQAESSAIAAAADESASSPKGTRYPKINHD